MNKEQTYYGVIDTSELSLRTPRAIDSDEFTSLWEAFRAAYDLITQNCATKVEIVRARFYPEHECWCEVTDGGFESITIDAEDAESWFNDDDEEEESDNLRDEGRSDGHGESYAERNV